MADQLAFSHQGQKGRLKGVFGIVAMMKQTQTEAKDHRPVAANERCERIFVFTGKEPVQQFLIGLVSDGLAGHPADLTNYLLHVPLVGWSIPGKVWTYP